MKLIILVTIGVFCCYTTSLKWRNSPVFISALSDLIFIYTNEAQILLTQLQMRLSIKDSRAKACPLSLLPNHSPSYKINKIGAFLFSSHLSFLYMCVHMYMYA